MTAYWCYRCHIAGHPTSAHPVSVRVTWLAEALRRLDFTAYGSLAELPNADTIAAAIVTEYTAVHDRYRRAHDETHDDPEDCDEGCLPFISHDPAPADLRAAAQEHGLCSCADLGGPRPLGDGREYHYVGCDYDPALRAALGDET